jgi:Domain of unknown function (DUF4124)
MNHRINAVDQRPRVLDVSRCQLQDIDIVDLSPRKVNRGRGKVVIMPNCHGGAGGVLLQPRVGKVVAISVKISTKSGFWAISITALLLQAVTAQADSAYYRWVDESGNPVISDRAPPPGTPYDEVSGGRPISGSGQDFGPGSEAPAEPPAAALSAPKETAKDPKYQWHEPEPEIQKVAFEKDPEKCQQAKDIIQTLDSFARIRATDQDGRYLTPEEKETRRAQANKSVERFCE